MENSTNGKIEINGTERPVIKVTLSKNSNGEETLHFDGAPEILDINFSKSDQTSLRKLFCWLLDKQLEQRFNLELVKDSSVKNDTYRKIADDYINDLNAEIDSIFIKEAQSIKELTAVDGVLSMKELKDK